jgi:hypothetical protein
LIHTFDFSLKGWWTQLLSYYNPYMQRLVHLLLIVLMVVQPGLVVQTGQAPFIVRYHPDGGLLVGDQVSLEIFTPTDFDRTGVKIQVDLLQPEKRRLGEAEVIPSGSGGQSTVLLWVWDTRGLPAGDYPLQFTLVPDQTTWQEIVHLQDPPIGEQPVWLERETQCCRLHYISGTDADRDINLLAQMVDERAQKVGNFFRNELSNPVSTPPDGNKLDVNLIPRALGQGGFAGNEVIVSYSDQNYIGGDPAMLIQHEITHRVDASLGGDLRPLILAEGLAVYVTGGHYKPEPIFLRAAALVHEGGGYIPLPVLAEDFYSHQHELGYLEAAALVGYMISTWGWDAYHQFYRDIHQAASQKDGDAIDAALRRHFGLSLNELDDRFSAWLSNLPVVPDLQKDLELTVAYYDLIRDYQSQQDPSAYFRGVWLPDPREMRQRGIVADYLRGPQDGNYLDLGNRLRKAGQAWRSGFYAEAWQYLWQVRRLLGAQ